MTQKQLAKELNVSQSLICYALKGKRNSQTAQRIRTLYAQKLNEQAEKIMANLHNAA
jgi:predicted transcriptional regulator